MSSNPSENEPDSKDFVPEGEAFNYDDILEHTGQMGKFQRRICLLLFIPALFPDLAILSNIFTGAIPDYKWGEFFGW